MNTKTEQYSLWKIMGIWLAAGAPMWILGWVAYPSMSNGLSPVDAGLLRIKLLTLGLVWQFILSMLILYREEGNIRFETIRHRFWLNHPVSQKTGDVQKSLWWWLIPLFILVAFIELGLGSVLTDVWLKIFPFFAEPPGYSFDTVFTPEARAQFVGDWGLLGLFFPLVIFNTFLGEELLFRGVLLPKMEGVFGKWDWVANAILFTFYHLHQPWGILAGIPVDLVFAYSAKRFRSNWFPIILHSTQSVFFLILVLGIILGLG